MKRIVALLFLLLLPMGCQAERFKGNLWLGARSIAHAMGEIEGHWYTNSLDALIENHERGWRTFETDLETTSDGKLILRHGWGGDLQDGIDGKHIPALEVFLATPIYETYMPTAFSDLCEWMLANPDVYIVLDSKVSEPSEVRRVFRELVREAKAVGAAEVLDRFVVYLYTEDMMQTVRKIWPFRSFIYATYLKGIRDENDFMRISRWCAKNHVPAAMWVDDYTDEIRAISEASGTEVYLHTVNADGIVMKNAALGAAGFITDTIDPVQMDGLYMQALSGKESRNEEK